MLPLVLPTVEIVKCVPKGRRWTVRSLCRAAGLECKVAGPSAKRKIYTYQISDCKNKIVAFREPGPTGPVAVGLSMNRRNNIALLVLGILAYSVFDYAARESLRGIPESKTSPPLGRPRIAKPLSGAERQRRWRTKKSSLTLARVTRLQKATSPNLENLK